MRIATDIGGTFTDLVALDQEGKVYTVTGETAAHCQQVKGIDILKKA
jgi:N-methylhydantoinase A/oxoprolinase/acetone carboxylase beta subunit